MCIYAAYTCILANESLELFALHGFAFKFYNFFLQKHDFLACLLQLRNAYNRFIITPKLLNEFLMIRNKYTIENL